MTLTITWTMIAWAIGLFLAWNGFLIGVIRWLLSREVSRFESRLTDADAKAGKALSAVLEHKQSVTDTMATQKQLMTEHLGALRIEFTNKATCANHSRMEGNDNKLFERLDSLHGDIRELVGGVDALTRSLDLVNQHLITSGGK